jgi:hypothetical protein
MFLSSILFPFLPRCRVGSGTASNEGIDESALPQSPLLCSLYRRKIIILPLSNKNIDCSCRFIIFQHLVLLL